MSEESVKRVLIEAEKIVIGSQNPRQDAVDYLETKVKMFPERARLWSALGAFYLENGQHVEALEAFRMAVELKPEVVCYQQELIDELRAHDRLEEAEQLAKKLLSMRPWDIDAKRRLADIQQAIMERPAESH